MLCPLESGARPGEELERTKRKCVVWGQAAIPPMLCWFVVGEIHVLNGCQSGADVSDTIGPTRKRHREKAKGMDLGEWGRSSPSAAHACLCVYDVGLGAPAGLVCWHITPYVVPLGSQSLSVGSEGLGPQCGPRGGSQCSWSAYWCSGLMPGARCPEVAESQTRPFRLCQALKTPFMPTINSQSELFPLLIEAEAGAQSGEVHGHGPRAQWKQ